MPLEAVLPSSNRTGPIVESVHLSRQDINDPFLSRTQPTFILLPSSESCAAIELHVICDSSVIVEQQEAGVWHPVRVLNKGQHAVVGSNTRFYISSRLSSTVVYINKYIAGTGVEVGTDVTTAAAPKALPSLAAVPKGAQLGSSACDAGPDHEQQPVKRHKMNDAEQDSSGRSSMRSRPPPAAGPSTSVCMQPGNSLIEPTAAPTSTSVGAVNHPTNVGAVNFPTAPFYLLAVRGLPPGFNSGCLGAKLCDLMPAFGLEFALISNYMVDLGWLVSACPSLLTAPRVAVVHGEHGNAERFLLKTAADLGLSHFTFHRPALPERFGTHHSKAILLQYAGGVRLVVHTANMIQQDCNNKTQGLWWQDFPRKAAGAERQTSDMEDTLADYFAAVRLPGPDGARLLSVIKAHDFSSARAHLLVSVPGVHPRPGQPLTKLHAYGHMAVRRVLSQYTMPSIFQDAPLLCQCSSMGSFNEQWLTGEFAASLCAGQYRAGQASAPESYPSPVDNAFAALKAGAKQADKKYEVQVVWPTVDEVRNSVEGWAAGVSIPGPAKNVMQPWLQPLYRRFGGEPVGRQCAMPHIKSYVRYAGSRLAYCLLTSSNLSKAAWGGLELQGKQLRVRSYEMGVLLTPEMEHCYRSSPHSGFKCANVGGTWATQSNCVASSGSDICGGSSNSTSGQGRGPSSHLPELLDMHEHVQFYTLESAATSFVAGGAAAMAAPACPGPGAAANVVHTRRMGAAVAVSFPGSPAQQPGTLRVHLPLPFKVPPEGYRPGEAPWAVDVDHPGLDALGQTVHDPRPSFYANTEAPG